MMKKQLLNLIQTNRLSHAYYLEGDNGDFVKWLAKQILCLQPGTESCDCSSCRRINNNNHVDLFEIEPDGLAIKVDQIREMNNKAALRSVDNRGQVFIIHQADKLNVQASNALLKFLEEPNEKVTILLTGHNQDKLLATIRSRVQVLKVPVDTTSIPNELAMQGIDFESLRICLDAGLSKEQIMNHATELDGWCELIHLTLNEPNYYDSLVWVKKWEKEFSDKEKKQISLLLIHSYIKGLFAVKKGQETNWKELATLDWSQLTKYLKEVDNLTQAIRSNGQYGLQCEMFIKRAKTA